MPFTIDEAIRATDWNNDNRYYGIVDTTDNNYILHYVPKKLTDGTIIDIANRHLNRDIASLVLKDSNSTGEYAKKYGHGYYLHAFIKNPRIYSRINGVVDMETAYRWNGSSWQYLSQKGHYVITNGQIWNRIGDNLSLHSSQSGFTPFDISKDGTYIITTEGYLIKRTGDCLIV